MTSGAAMTPLQTLPDGYRPCAGAVVFDDTGRVFMGRRIDLPPDADFAWQLPQGGIDADEDFEAAARRELYEETGIRSVSLIGSVAGWLHYDFPADLQGKRFRKYKGQAQRWFAYEFSGDAGEIDLAASDAPEFGQFDWVPLNSIPTLIVPFKREVYAAIVHALAPIALRYGDLRETTTR